MVENMIKKIDIHECEKFRSLKPEGTFLSGKFACKIFSTLNSAHFQFPIKDPVRK